MPSVSSTCRSGGCLEVLRCPVSVVRVREEVALRSKVPSVSSTCRRGVCLVVLMCPVSVVRVGEEVALWS